MDLDKQPLDQTSDIDNTSTDSINNSSDEEVEGLEEDRITNATAHKVS